MPVVVDENYKEGQLVCNGPLAIILYNLKPSALHCVSSRNYHHAILRFPPDLSDNEGDKQDSQFRWYKPLHSKTSHVPGQWRCP
jgi:hypothetical protein